MPLQPSGTLTRKERRKSALLLASTPAVPHNHAMSFQNEVHPDSRQHTPAVSPHEQDLDDAFGGPVSSLSEPDLWSPAHRQPEHHPHHHHPLHSHQHHHSHILPHSPLRATRTTLDEAFGGSITTEDAEPQPAPVSPPLVIHNGVTGDVNQADYDSLPREEKGEGPTLDDSFVVPDSTPATNPFLPPIIAQREPSLPLINVHPSNPFFSELVGSLPDIEQEPEITVQFTSSEPAEFLEPVVLTTTAKTPWEPMETAHSVETTGLSVPRRTPLHSQSSIAEAFGEGDDDFDFDDQQPTSVPAPEWETSFASASGSQELEPTKRSVSETDFNFDDDEASKVDLDKNFELTFEPIFVTTNGLEVPPPVIVINGDDQSQTLSDSVADFGDFVTSSLHPSDPSRDSSTTEQEDGDENPEDTSKLDHRAIGEVGGASEEPGKTEEEGEVKKSSKKPRKVKDKEKDTEKPKSKKNREDKIPKAPLASEVPTDTAAIIPAALTEEGAEQPKQLPPKSPREKRKSTRLIPPSEGPPKSAEEILAPVTSPPRSPKPPRKKKAAEAEGNDITEDAPVTTTSTLKDFNDLLSAAFD